MVIQTKSTDFEKLNKLYPLIYEWLTCKTFGNKAYESSFRYYDENLWLQIANMVNSIRGKTRQTKLEKEFLSCVYTGKIYRIHTYDESRKYHIYPWGHYQSWSTEEGLSMFRKHGGKKLLICAETRQNDVAINTFSLLTFMFKNLNVKIPNERYHPKHLCVYEEENEIVFPINKENIYNVVIIEANHLTEWEFLDDIVPKHFWFAKT